MSAVIRSIAVLMLVGMLLQINSALVCYGLFTLNQKAISENLCERKMTDCSGHCFLLKTINTTNDTRSEAAGKPASSKTFEQLLNAMPGLLPDLQHAPVRISTGKRVAANSVSSLSDGVSPSIDQPPNAGLAVYQV